MRATTTAEQTRADEALAEAWADLSAEDRASSFERLPRAQREEFFLSRPPRDQAEILGAIPAEERRAWVRLLAPDDMTDLVQELPAAERDDAVALLDEPGRMEVRALLAYAEDEAGGLMSPRYARLRSDMTVAEAIPYLRAQAKERLETVYYIYVLDEAQHLLGLVSFRELFGAPSHALVRDVMRTDVVTVREDEDQETVCATFKEHPLLAIPVVDAEKRLQGIVTLDDVLDVVDEEATEDMQKAGGMESLGAPYLEVSLRTMVWKRAGWLAALFLGEMLTATAMAFYEEQIARAVVLALFVPLIISTGGNSGSQASTLVIRAMALGQVRLAHWWRVVRREIATGVLLGALLGAIGFLRIVVWQAVRPIYGEHYLRLGLTVGLSLVGVVTLGTFAGSVLPLGLRAMRLDPASASGPFVATVVDVAGLVIYFTIAGLVLGGLLA